MIYAFEDCTLDLDRVELRRAGEPVAIEPQVFEVLRVLIDRRERVVTRDELLAQVWNGRFVSDSALSSRIKSLRRAIGDDGKAQRLVRTVQRRGFRFVGEVREIAPAAQPPAPAPAPAPERMVAELLSRPAVAVLPFTDMTTPTGAGYLADGVTDEVAAALCAWRCFPVISRNTSFRYRGSDLSAPEIGRATGARYLLVGALQVSEGRARLSAALIDAETDRQMWSGRILRPVDEIFTLQEALAREVVAQIEPEMRAAEMQRILRKPAGDLDAWDLAMRAMWCANRGAEGDFDEAERLASGAAERAPHWHLPYALIALVKFHRAMRGFSAADARTAFAGTLQAARRALEIDGASWIAHALTGVGELWTNRDHDRALAHVHRAIELNPSACQNYHFGGCITGFSGDPAAARRHQGRIFRIDPAYAYAAVIEADLGLWHMIEGDLEAAAARLERAERADPRYGRAYQRQVALGGLKGDRGISERAIRRLSEIGTPINREQLIASYPFRREEQREVFFTGLRRAGVNV
ncbi:MAG: winged helix-turn-helix domain-containing protein [Pseudomonadota bacterium]